MIKTLQTQLRSASKSERASLLVDYLRAHGDEHYEEDVTQYQHAVQAAYLGVEAGASDELIVAALLHDIGHILADDHNEANNPTVKNDFHEVLAANYLKDFFPAAVLEPILLHVPAKRYICTVDSSYYDQLSLASQKSFHLQGGKMESAERADFESNPHYINAVQLRKWDDLAKDVTKEVPDIAYYQARIEKVLL